MILIFIFIYSIIFLIFNEVFIRFSFHFVKRNMLIRMFFISFIVFICILSEYYEFIANFFILIKKVSWLEKFGVISIFLWLAVLSLKFSWHVCFLVTLVNFHIFMLYLFLLFPIIFYFHLLLYSIDFNFFFIILFVYNHNLNNFVYYFILIFKFVLNIFFIFFIFIFYLIFYIMQNLLIFFSIQIQYHIILFLYFLILLNLMKIKNYYWQQTSSYSHWEVLYNLMIIMDSFITFIKYLREALCWLILNVVIFML